MEEYRYLENAIYNTEDSENSISEQDYLPTNGCNKKKSQTTKKLVKIVKPKGKIFITFRLPKN